MENTDSTTWIKESGLIAHDSYYDAPELRHLVNRGDNGLDEEGNDIPLPEIRTSIDPQQDPDYSSWGKDAASVNYIGFIAYLVKASSELHERVKALEPTYKYSEIHIYIVMLIYCWISRHLKSQWAKHLEH